MTEVTVPEGGNGITRVLVINRRGQAAPENLTTSGYTAATMALTSLNHRTIYNASITLALSSPTAGELTWTLNSATDLLPSVPDNRDEMTILGQVTLTGSGIEDRTEDFQITIQKNITS